jgi:SAM-dependent methyltransferase
VVLDDLGDRQGVSGARFRIVGCDACDNAYLSPRPTMEALGRFYPAGYWFTEGEAPRGLVARVKALEARYRRALLMSEVKRLRAIAPPGGRLLDVGCGSGDIVKLAGESGLVAQGVEFSAEAVAYARESRGLDVRVGTLESAGYPDAAFDVVSLFHVLEHVPDPVATLREARRVLAPGGAVLLQVPNFASGQSRLFGARWHAVEAPRHFHHFTPATLGRAVEAAGLTVERVDHHSFRCAPVAFVSSMFPSLEPHVFLMKEQRGRSQVVAKALYLALTWAFAPVAWLESVAGRGGFVTLVARRPAERIDGA